MILYTLCDFVMDCTYSTVPYILYCTVQYTVCSTSIKMRYINQVDRDDYRMTVRSETPKVYTFLVPGTINLCVADLLD